MGQTMSNDENVDRQAQYWLLEFSSGEADEATSSAFRRWCDADPSHSEAYRQAARRFYSLSQIDPALAAEITGTKTLRERQVDAVRRFRRRLGSARRNPAWWMFGVGLAAALMLVAVLIQPLLIGGGNSPQQYSTAIAEIRDITLPDGSVITLGAHSALSVDYDRTERRVRLSRGQAYFDVANEAGRPFRAIVGATEITVLGTEFDIHRGETAVTVAVTDGVVRVSHPATAKDPGQAVNAEVTLEAGQQVMALGGQLSDVESTGENRPGAWRQGKLVYVNARLQEIIADANRYSSQRIVLQNSEIADLRVTTGFRTDQIEDMLTTLSMALPIELNPGLDGNIFIRKKEKQKK